LEVELPLITSYHLLPPHGIEPAPIFAFPRCPLLTLTLCGSRFAIAKLLTASLPSKARHPSGDGSVVDILLYTRIPDSFHQWLPNLFPHHIFLQTE
jgi:hypothetical protein